MNFERELRKQEELTDKEKFSLLMNLQNDLVEGYNHYGITQDDIVLFNQHMTCWLNVNEVLKEYNKLSLMDDTIALIKKCIEKEKGRY